MTDVLASIIAAHAPLKVARLSSNLAALDFRLMKIYPAANIIAAGQRAGTIKAGTTIIETSSGTMALGLAIVCRHMKLPLHIVGDKAIEAPLKRTLEDLGATVHIIQASVADGNVQTLRLKALQELQKSTNAFWTQQYDNIDNRLAYAAPAAEAIRQFGKPDYLVGPVGSGGSSTGLAHFLRKLFPEMLLVGVDTYNSVLYGQPPGPRDFRGLGNSLVPKNVDHRSFDHVHFVSANQGFHAASELQRSISLKRGPTSGAAHMVAKWYADQYPDKNVLAVFPDDGTRYEHTVFDPAWMNANGYTAARVVPIPVPVTHPLLARPEHEWNVINWRRRSLREVLEASPAQTLQVAS